MVGCGAMACGFSTHPKKAGAVKLAAAVLVVVALLVGCSSPSIKNGQGTYTFADGATYTGEYKDDRFNGQGTITYADGIAYTGEFKHGEFNGQGTATHPDGTTYTGAFKDDQPNGQGTITYPDGGKRTGEWKDGKLVP